MTNESSLRPPHCQFQTSPNSSHPLQSPFISCSSSSSSKAGSPPEMPLYLWNYIHSPGSKKASNVKNVSTSKVTRPLSQKKSDRFSVSPSVSSSQSSSVGCPMRRYRPRDSRSPFLHPSTFISRPLLGCSSKAMCPPRRKPPRRLHNPVHVNLPKPGHQKSLSCHKAFVDP